MKRTIKISKDDLFVLGSLGAYAVTAGQGEAATSLLKFIQQERPENAGGFLMEAVFLFSQGRVKDAIAFLDEADVFDAETNGEEAIAFYLVLLQADGQIERARSLGKSCLSTDRFVSESARQAIAEVLEETDGINSKISVLN